MIDFYYGDRRAFCDALPGRWQGDKDQLAELPLSVLGDSDDRNIFVDAQPLMVWCEF